MSSSLVLKKRGSKAKQDSSSVYHGEWQAQTLSVPESAGDTKMSSNYHHHHNQQQQQQQQSYAAPSAQLLDCNQNASHLTSDSQNGPSSQDAWNDWSDQGWENWSDNNNQPSHQDHQFSQQQYSESTRANDHPYGDQKHYNQNQYSVNQTYQQPEYFDQHHQQYKQQNYPNEHQYPQHYGQQTYQPEQQIHQQVHNQQINDQQVASPHLNDQQQQQQQQQAYYNNDQCYSQYNNYSQAYDQSNGNTQGDGHSPSIASSQYDQSFNQDVGGHQSIEQTSNQGSVTHQPADQLSLDHPSQETYSNHSIDQQSFGHQGVGEQSFGQQPVNQNSFGHQSLDQDSANRQLASLEPVVSQSFDQSSTLENPVVQDNKQYDDQQCVDVQKAAQILPEQHSQQPPSQHTSNQEKEEPISDGWDTLEDNIEHLSIHDSFTQQQQQPSPIEPIVQEERQNNCGLDLSNEMNVGLDLRSDLTVGLESRNNFSPEHDSKESSSAGNDLISDPNVGLDLRNNPNIGLDLRNDANTGLHQKNTPNFGLEQRSDSKLGLEQMSDFESEQEMRKELSRQSSRSQFSEQQLRNTSTPEIPQVIRSRSTSGLSESNAVTRPESRSSELGLTQTGMDRRRETDHRQSSSSETRRSFSEQRNEYMADFGLSQDEQEIIDHQSLLQRSAPAGVEQSLMRQSPLGGESAAPPTLPSTSNTLLQIATPAAVEPLPVPRRNSLTNHKESRKIESSKHRKSRSSDSSSSDEHEMANHIHQKVREREHELPTNVKKRSEKSREPNYYSDESEARRRRRGRSNRDSDDGRRRRAYVSDRDYTADEESYYYDRNRRHRRGSDETESSVKDHRTYRSGDDTDGRPRRRSDKYYYNSDVEYSRRDRRSRNYYPDSESVVGSVMTSDTEMSDIYERKNKYRGFKAGRRYPPSDINARSVQRIPRYPVDHPSYPTAPKYPTPAARPNRMFPLADLTGGQDIELIKQAYQADPEYRYVLDDYFARCTLEGYDISQVKSYICSTAAKSELNTSLMTTFSDNVDASSMIYGSAEQSGPKELQKFSLPHTFARFGSSNLLIKLHPVSLGSDTKPPMLELHDTKLILEESIESKQLEKFPGPLVRAETNKNQVIHYCNQRISAIQKNKHVLVDAESQSLLWELLILMLKQNGHVSGADIAELLLKDAPFVDPTSVQKLAEGAVTETEQASSDDSQTTVDQTSLNRSRRQRGMLPEQALAKFRELLLFGHRRDAIEHAIRYELWGHAFCLSSKMDMKIYAHVHTKFYQSLAINDPLQTIYQLYSGRQPTSVNCVGDLNWGDWRPHLAMILTNPSMRPEVDARSIITMGDVLLSRGFICAAHFCYLMAQVDFGEFKDKSVKLVLIGSNNMKKFEEFATNEAIMCTEIYEYAQSLSNPNYALPTLAAYKFLHAKRLLDRGFVQESLHYCERLALEFVRNKDVYQMRLIQAVYQMASRLRYHDAHYTQGSGEHEELGDPEWLMRLQQLCFETKNDAYEENSAYSQSGDQVTHSGTLETIDEATYYGNTAHRGSIYSDQQSVGEVEQRQHLVNPVVPAASNSVPLAPPAQYPDYQYGNEQQQQQQQQQQPQQPMVPIKEEPMNRRSSVDAYAAVEQPVPTFPSMTDIAQQPLQQPQQYQQPLQQAGYGLNKTENEFKPIHSDFQPHVQDNQPVTSSNYQTNQVPPTPYQPPAAVSRPREPEKQEPSGKQARKAEKAATTSDAGRSWLNGFFGKLLPKGPNQVNLPDDKDQSIVWDEAQGRWVDRTADPATQQDAFAPPPSDLTLGAAASPAPAAPPSVPQNDNGIQQPYQNVPVSNMVQSPLSTEAPAVNRFQMSKNKPRYVDVLKQSNQTSAINTPMNVAAGGLPANNSVPQFFIPGPSQAPSGSEPFDLMSNRAQYDENEQGAPAGS